MIVAFDPGLSDKMPGGWCIMNDGEITLAEELPRDGKLAAVPYLVETIETFGDPRLMVVERQHARPQDGHRSLNVMLPAYGQLVAMAQALRWPLVIVQPKEWKALVLKGTSRDKEASCAHVSTRYPSVNLHPGRRRIAHDGIADAVCIAEWAHRSNP